MGPPSGTPPPPPRGALSRASRPPGTAPGAHRCRGSGRWGRGGAPRAAPRGRGSGERAAAVEAVVEARGKKPGPDDARTEPQRYHDALQLACELLLHAKLVPDRAGAATRADVVMALSQLRSMPGAPEVEHAYLAALAGEHGYLSGAGAQAAACDASTTPLLTGHPHPTV